MERRAWHTAARNIADSYMVLIGKGDASFWYDYWACDDNLFGPVSTSFIRPGRLSEVSDDNDHDITLDSTAFSMHFSNILPLDDQSVNAGGSPRMPIEDYIEKESGGFMPLSGSNKKVLGFTLSNEKSSGGTGYSSDMTLVAENSKSYDYGKLPPTLEVLLAKVNEAMQPQNPNDRPSLLSCSPNKGTGPSAGASTDKIEQATFSPVLHAKDGIHKAEPLVPADASETDVISLPSEQSQKRGSLQQDHMPKGQLIDRTRENKYCSKFSHVSASDVPAHIAPNAVQISSGSHECKTHTPTGIQDGNDHISSPMESSISCLRAKRRRLFDGASVPLQSGSAIQTPLSSKRKITLHSDNVSKFETFEVEESVGSKSRTSLLSCDHKSHMFRATLDSSENYNCAKPLNISLSQVGEHVIGTTGGVAGLEVNSKMHIHGLETPSSVRKSGCNEEVRAATETIKQTEVMIQIPGAGGRKIEKSIWPENPTEGASCPTISSSKQKMFNVKEDMQVLDTFSKLVSSPMSLLGQKHTVLQEQCFTPLASGSRRSNSLLKEVRSETPLPHVTFSFVETRKLANQNATPEAGTVQKGSVVGIRNVRPVSQERDHKMGKDPDSIIEKIADGRPDVLSFPDPCKKAMTIKESEKVNEVPHANDTINEPGRTPKTQKVMPIIKSNIAESSPAQHRQHVVRDNEAVGHLPWTELLTKIIEDTREPFSLSINKLNLSELDVLEDLVCELQKARKFERLCSDMQTLGKCHDLGHQKRLSEIRLLKETLLYEQAKLQLKSIRRDRLLKKTHVLKSKINDFCKLRSSFKQMIDKQSCLLPVSVPNVIIQDEHGKVLSMRQELKTLDEKMKGFVNLFGTSCNIDTSLGIDEIINAICDNLEKRNHCRVIRQHLQLWRLIGVVNQNDQCDIMLNYCNILSQRFTIKVTSASMFGVEISLDDAKIEKSFPNMKASVAFHFVFNGSKGHKRLGNIGCFQVETQATSFIFGNLLDVLQEIQISQMQCPNLMSSTFCAQSAGKLELQLYFLDLKSGKKVALSLDMTHLNCAVYPSETSELKIEVFSLNSALSQTVSDEIMCAIRSLKSGHLFLMRLCRCVSQLIQSSKM